jgi:glutathione S-transferase
LNYETVCHIHFSVCSDGKNCYSGKNLEKRVEIIPAQTRETNSPYYLINPSGRVPYLIQDDGVGMEDSQLICAYLDHLDGTPIFDHPSGSAGWRTRRLEALARSLMESLCVWGRVLALPEGERSPTVVEHERQRSKRLVSLWESEIDHPLLNGEINLIQITLVCALQLDRRNSDNQWRPDHPKLSSWADRINERTSIADTLPPLVQK